MVSRLTLSMFENPVAAILPVFLFVFLPVLLNAQAQSKLDAMAGPLPGTVEQLQSNPAWRLLLAIDTRDHEALRTLLDRGEPPNRRAPNGQIPLNTAAQIGDLDAAKMLVKAGAEINASNPHRTSVLRDAVEFGQVDLVSFLLANGAQVNARNAAGETALFSALRHRRQDLLKLLIQAGADVNARNTQDDTPLTLAAKDDDLELVQLLKDAGARFSSPQEELLYAASDGSVNAIRRVLAPGVNVNRHYGRGITPLIAAAQNGETAAVKLLLAAGADINGFDTQNDTALMFAIKSKHQSTIQALIDGGADVTLLDMGGVSTLEQAATYLDDPDLVRLLIHRGVPLDGAKSLINHTPLMAAAAFGNIETAQILLAAGAEVNAQSKEGLTPLMDGALGGNPEILMLLLNAGANPTLKSKDGKTALDYARQVHEQSSSAVSILEKLVTTTTAPAPNQASSQKK
jgi:ankyrin repeat protein